MDTVFFGSFAGRRSWKIEDEQPGITRRASDGLVESDGRVHTSYIATVTAVQTVRNKHVDHPSVIVQ